MDQEKRDFYLFKRSGSEVYQVQLVSPMAGKRLGARTTGETNRDKAIVKAAQWVREGVVPSIYPKRAPPPSPKLQRLLEYSRPSRQPKSVPPKRLELFKPSPKEIY